MGEIFDCLDVEACCSLSVITTLEFLEHHFAKVGHRLAPYDPTLSRTHHYCRHHARESVRREAAAFKRAYRHQLSESSATLTRFRFARDPGTIMKVSEMAHPI